MLLRGDSLMYAAIKVLTFQLPSKNTWKPFRRIMTVKKKNWTGCQRGCQEQTRLWVGVTYAVV